MRIQNFQGTCGFCLNIWQDYHFFDDIVSAKTMVKSLQRSSILDVSPHKIINEYEPLKLKDLYSDKKSFFDAWTKAKQARVVSQETDKIDKMDR